MNKEIIEALKKVYDKLIETNILWVLSGSVSLAIQGVDVEPRNDIDILTDESGSEKIYLLLKDFCTKKPEYSSTDKYCSYFSIYEVDGINVEVMGDFQYKLKNGEWSVKNHLHEIKEFEYEKMKIPVLEISQELQEYKNLNRQDKVEKIERFLNND